MLLKLLKNMPSVAELLKKREAEEPVGQRFGLNDRSSFKHDQEAQTVIKIVADLGEQRAAVDVLETRVVRTGKKSSEQAVVEKKIGRKIINLQETDVR
jgi:hypothetical protein